MGRLSAAKNLGYFLSRAGLAGYKSGFIGHYLEPLVYPGGMPRNFELIAGISIILWNILVYEFVLLYGKRRQQNQGKGLRG